MSVHVLSWVLKHSPAQGNDRLCLLVLADYADETGLSWPGLERIAWEMGQVSVRTAQRALRSLEAVGRIVTLPNGAPDSRLRGDRKPNAYRIQRGDGLVTPWESNGVTPGSPRGDRSGTDGVTAAVTGSTTDPSEERSPRKPPKGGDTDPAFVVFYEAYPKHLGRRPAASAWHRAVKRASVETIMVGVQALGTLVADGQDLQFVRHPATWLNQNGWEDELIARPPSMSKTAHAIAELRRLDATRGSREGTDRAGGSLAELFGDGRHRRAVGSGDG